MENRFINETKQLDWKKIFFLRFKHYTVLNERIALKNKMLKRVESCPFCKFSRRIWRTWGKVQELGHEPNKTNFYRGATFKVLDGLMTPRLRSSYAAPPEVEGFKPLGQSFKCRQQLFTDSKCSEVFHKWFCLKWTWTNGSPCGSSFCFHSTACVSLHIRISFKQISLFLLLMQQLV